MAKAGSRTTRADRLPLLGERDFSKTREPGGRPTRRPSASRQRGLQLRSGERLAQLRLQPGISTIPWLTCSRSWRVFRAFHHGDSATRCSTGGSPLFAKRTTCAFLPSASPGTGLGLVE